MALLVLLQEWAGARNRPLVAFTVDHQLRPGSTFEARRVADWCALWGIEHHLLSWKKNTAPSSAIHAQARQARYDLLLKACQHHGCDGLFLAHHRDDQAETILMRLAHHTGLDGAAGMPLAVRRTGITLLRPLLPVCKETLVATCHARRVPFVTDPSNAATRFRRGQLRADAPRLRAAGLTSEKLYDFACAAGQARALLEEKTSAWLETHAIPSAYGFFSLPAALFLSLSEDRQQRILARVLRSLSGEPYPPRCASLHAVLNHLKNGSRVFHTLSGCCIEKIRDRLMIFREADMCKHVLPLVAAKAGTAWDHRFRIMVDEKLNFENVVIAPLGALSRAALEKMNAHPVAALPARIRACLPALFVHSTLIHIPAFHGLCDKTRTTPLALPQGPVKAEFFPAFPLMVSPFKPAPPLSRLFGVV